MKKNTNTYFTINLENTLSKIFKYLSFFFCEEAYTYLCDKILLVNLLVYFLYALKISLTTSKIYPTYFNKSSVKDFFYGTSWFLQISFSSDPYTWRCIKYAARGNITLYGAFMHMLWMLFNIWRSRKRRNPGYSYSNSKFQNNISCLKVYSAGWISWLVPSSVSTLFSNIEALPTLTRQHWRNDMNVRYLKTNKQCS